MFNPTIDCRVRVRGTGRRYVQKPPYLYKELYLLTPRLHRAISPLSWPIFNTLPRHLLPSGKLDSKLENHY